MTHLQRQWIALWLVCLTVWAPWAYAAAMAPLDVPAHHEHLLSAATGGQTDDSHTASPTCHNICVACAIPASEHPVTGMAATTHPQFLLLTRIPQIPLPTQERPPRSI